MSYRDAPRPKTPREAALEGWERAADEARAAGLEERVRRWARGMDAGRWTEVDGRARELRKDVEAYQALRNDVAHAGAGFVSKGDNLIALA